MTSCMTMILQIDREVRQLFEGFFGFIARMKKYGNFRTPIPVNSF